MILTTKYNLEFLIFLFEGRVDDVEKKIEERLIKDWKNIRIKIK